MSLSGSSGGGASPWMMALFLAAGVIGGVLMVLAVLLVCKFCCGRNPRSDDSGGGCFGGSGGGSGRRKSSFNYNFESSIAIPQELDSFQCSEYCSAAEPLRRGSPTAAWEGGDDKQQQQQQQQQDEEEEETPIDDVVTQFRNSLGSQQQQQQPLLVAKETKKLSQIGQLNLSTNAGFESSRHSHRLSPRISTHNSERHHPTPPSTPFEHQRQQQQQQQQQQQRTISTPTPTQTPTPTPTLVATMSSTSTSPLPPYGQAFELFQHQQQQLVGNRPRRAASSVTRATSERVTLSPQHHHHHQQQQQQPVGRQPSASLLTAPGSNQTISGAGPTGRKARSFDAHWIGVHQGQEGGVVDRRDSPPSIVSYNDTGSLEEVQDKQLMLDEIHDDELIGGGYFAQRRYLPSYWQPGVVYRDDANWQRQRPPLGTAVSDTTRPDPRQLWRLRCSFEAGPAGGAAAANSMTAASSEANAALTETRRQHFRQTVLARRSQKTNASGDTSLDSFETATTDPEVEPSNSSGPGHNTTTSFESSTGAESHTDSTGGNGGGGTGGGSSSGSRKLHQMQRDSGYKSVESQVPSGGGSVATGTGRTLPTILVGQFSLRLPSSSKQPQPPQSPRLSTDSAGLSPQQHLMLQPQQRQRSLPAQPTLVKAQQQILIHQQHKLTPQLHKQQHQPPQQQRQQQQQQQHAQSQRSPTLIVTQADPAPTDSKASARRRKFSEDRRRFSPLPQASPPAVQVLQHPLEMEDDEDEADYSQDFQDNADSKAPVFNRFFNQQQQQPQKRQSQRLQRDYSIDERTNAIFNEFLKVDDCDELPKDSPMPQHLLQPQQQHSRLKRFETDRTDYRPPSAGRASPMSQRSRSYNVETAMPSQQQQQQHYYHHHQQQQWPQQHSSPVRGYLRLPPGSNSHYLTVTREPRT